MRAFKSLSLCIAVLLIAAPSFAQMTEDPTSWKYEVKKKSATEYQLIFHLTLKLGYHIWSLHPGGDGYEISPSYTFNKNAAVTLTGPTKITGKHQYQICNDKMCLPPKDKDFSFDIK